MMEILSCGPNLYDVAEHSIPNVTLDEIYPSKPSTNILILLNDSESKIIHLV